MVRLGVPAQPALEQHFGPLIVAQLELREPHALAEYDPTSNSRAKVCRAGDPTVTIDWFRNAVDGIQVDRMYPRSRHEYEPRRDGRCRLTV
jgi:hypothetical protein